MKDRLSKYLTLAYLKAHVALVGGLLTWYLASYPHGPGVRYVAIGIGVLTALGVGVASNKSEDEVLDDVKDVAEHFYPEADSERRSDVVETPVEDKPSPTSLSA